MDGADPWAALGPLTGSYSGTVTALATDCVRGPDVPFDFDPSDAFEPFSEYYDGTVEQRGDAVVFELGEGLVFARREADRLVEVVRVGAEGVTHYHDGFPVVPTAVGWLVSGESAWTFRRHSWLDQTCGGRASFALAVRDDAPTAGPRDLQFVLRWPVQSSADLDLMVEFGEERAFLGEVQNRCHVLHSAGTAGAAEDSEPVSWIHPLEATEVPHHEEIIRCAAAPYGAWHIDVVNWSGDEAVDFALEIFEGPSLGVDPAAERALRLFRRTVAPHSREQLEYDHAPPPSDPGAGLIIVSPGTFATPRPLDPISGSVLGFNKAAALDVGYEEFLQNVGIE